MSEHLSWATPGGMHVAAQMPATDGEPCLIVMRNGFQQMGQLLEFSPDEATLLFLRRQADSAEPIALSDIRWLRLLAPVCLVHAGSLAPFEEDEWERVLKEADIGFSSGEHLKGWAPALMQTAAGWFFFLGSETAKVSRYFIPHGDVTSVLLDGCEQRRFDQVAVHREMRHPRLAELMQADEERYPFALEAKFDRVLHQIMEYWDNPILLEEYFENLMVDKRGGRQGFPTDVAHDIFKLSSFYDEWRHQRAEPEDPWAAETARQELEEQGYAFTAQRFHHAVENNEFAATSLYLQAGMSVDTPASKAGRR